MVKKIIVVIGASAILFFCVRWLIKKDVSWEPITATIASLITILTTIWGIVEKKFKPQPEKGSQQLQFSALSPYQPATQKIPAQKESAETNSEEVQKDESIDLAEFRRRLLMAQSPSQLNELYLELKQLSKSNRNREVLLLLYHIQAALKIESTKNRNYQGSNIKQTIHDLKVMYYSREQMPSRKYKNWLEIIFQIVIVLGFCYVVYRIVRYFIVNW